MNIIRLRPSNRLGGFGLGVPYVGLQYGIDVGDESKIRGMIGNAISELDDQVGDVESERRGIMEFANPAPIQDLQVFSSGELLQQVLLDLDALLAAKDALLNVAARKYGTPTQIADLDAIELKLKRIAADVPLGQDQPIRYDYKGLSDVHRDKHTAKVSEISLEAYRAVVAAEGAVSAPIGDNLANETPPKAGPGQTVSEDPFPWWILLVAGGIIWMSS